MSTKPNNTEDPKKARTKAATLANMRRREERYAALLIERGWKVTSPYADENEDNSTKS